MLQLSLPMKLPLEIIHLIINETDDLQTLRSWACVNWTFRTYAERILWRSVVIHCDHFDNDWKHCDSPADIIWTLKKEAAYEEHPETWSEWSVESPPICRRAAYVKALSLRARLAFDSVYDDSGIIDGYVINTFEWLSLVLANLRSVRLDGSFSQRAWDSLLALPALRELRLWRTRSVSPEILNFQGLSKLQAFEIGSLLFTEAVALGTAVRESNLEILHIAVREDESSWEPNTLLPFFDELVGIDYGNSDGSRDSANECYGFPPSLLELAIEDEDNEEISEPEIFQRAFRRCSRLSSLYLDIKDTVLLEKFLPELHLPRLKHLYLPLIIDHSRQLSAAAMTDVIAKFVERHRETLTLFRVLNLMEDDSPVADLCLKLRPWFTVQELRFEGGDMEDLESEDGWQWPRVGKFISVDGSANYSWGGDLRRVRFDKFDITDMHISCTYHPDWARIKILVLNPLLPWHYGLFPDPNESTSILAQDLERKHLLGSVTTSRQRESTERIIVERVIHMETPKPTIRVVSINEFRFWIEPDNQRIWHLRDALEDREQSLIVNRSLDARDWEFLSERTATSSVRGSNNATFLRPDSASPAPPHIVSG